MSNKSITVQEKSKNKLTTLGSIAPSNKIED